LSASSQTSACPPRQAAMPGSAGTKLRAGGDEVSRPLRCVKAATAAQYATACAPSTENVGWRGWVRVLQGNMRAQRKRERIKRKDTQTHGAECRKIPVPQAQKKKQKAPNAEVP